MKDPRILFVHVGKAGGETIKNILEMGCKSRKNMQRRRECLRTVPDSALSEKVQGYFHCWTIEPRKFHPNSYLFNVRHPVDRAISWYRYVHPEHCKNKKKSGSPVCIAKWQLQNNPTGWVGQFFQQCFPQVEDWAMGLHNNNTLCLKLAKQTFEGDLSEKEVPLAAHMIANYKHYIEKTVRIKKDAQVLVVRTDSLWQDLKDLDIWLGGKGEFGQAEGSAVTHGSEHYHHSQELSEKATTHFCCALQEELTLYRELIERAENLEDKEQELRNSVQRCGAKSWQKLLDTCSRQAKS
jgi:hypothetical protein